MIPSLESDDRAWFRQHVARNFRIRDPHTGELEEMIQRADIPGADVASPPP
jgi:hypothetical protein